MLTHESPARHDFAATLCLAAHPAAPKAGVEVILGQSWTVSGWPADRWQTAVCGPPQPAACRGHSWELSASWLQQDSIS